jgi:mono/diheme cytochrome c family protein
MTGKLMLIGSVCFSIVAGAEAGEVSLSEDLMPLFERSCAVCHKRDGGKDKAIQNGVFYETKDDILSKVGTFIVAGKPEESGLLKVLNQTQKFGRRKTPMPPPKASSPKWSAAELKQFSDWVTAGAKDS